VANQKKSASKLLPVGQIAQRILWIRERKVILDADLAELYGTQTKRLNEQVKRNRDRFPDDFLFQLTAREKSEVVANCDHLDRLKYSPRLPYAFTEHGALMVAAVLNTPRAVNVSIYVVRAFVKLRDILASNEELAVKLTELEQRVSSHDATIGELVDAIRQLMAPEPGKKRSIGFAEWSD
jgi:hypothetical protein